MDSPLIDGGKARQILELDVNRIIGQYANLSIDVRRFFKNKRVWIYECLSTGYRFYGPDEIFGDSPFYGELFEKIPGYYHEKRWEHFKALNYVESNKSLLEIGVGSGLFLERAMKKGASVAGLELSENAIKACLAKGLPVLNETIESYAQLKEQQFDIVCSFQVLEHIDKPGQFINASLKCLTVGGLFMIAVPNSNPYLFRHDLYHTLNLPPHHAGLWNVETLQKLVDHFPIDLVNISVSPLTEHKHWFNTQVDHLKESNPGFAKALKFIPRPIYKFLTRLGSPFIEGQFLLAVFKKC